MTRNYTKHKIILYLIMFFFLEIHQPTVTFAQNSPPLQLIKLPPGFKINVFAQNIPNARELALGDKGTVFVGSRTGDKIYALEDIDHDGVADRQYIVAKNLWAPNGVAFHQGSLYVGEINRIIRFDHIEDRLSNPPEPVVINDQFPKDTWHGWKFIDIGPDHKIYVPVGSPCNVCEQNDARYGSIMRMDLDGTNLEIFAKGIRNTVGFDWDPATEELWFTDNGRDNLGDNLPPDELNHAPEKGLNFGFPYCHGKNILDPDFGKNRSCDEFHTAAQELGPHVASLGMIFYQGNSFPNMYRNQILIAEHGSWNRSKKLGYRITMVELENNKPVSYKIFAEGWNIGEKVWGRPVDLLNYPDGSILVSDDYGNTIYRISYEPVN